MANLNDHQKANLLSCRTECKGMLITLVLKMIMLAIGSWAAFFRRPQATMPRIFLFRSVVLLMVLICCVAYWLFYFVQITEGKVTIWWKFIRKFIKKWQSLRCLGYRCPWRCSWKRRTRIQNFSSIRFKSCGYAFIHPLYRCYLDRNSTFAAALLHQGKKKLP